MTEHYIEYTDIDRRRKPKLIDIMCIANNGDAVVIADQGEPLAVVIGVDAYDDLIKGKEYI